MYCKCHKINFKRDGPYIESLVEIKNKKATTNPKNKDDRCFQYAATIALNFDKIKKYPSKIDEWKRFNKNNPTIVLNALYIKDLEICPAYVSKINSNCEKQIIILMIPNKKRRLVLP